MLSKGVLLLAVLTAGAIAASDYQDSDSSDYQNDETAQGSQCVITCPVSSSSSKFGYETGKTYEYRYESDIKTTVPGGTAEHSSLHVRSTVQIEVLSTCEMVLKVTEVSLQDSSPTNIESRQHVANTLAFRTALQSKPLTFAFIDGRIDTICPDRDDEIWAVNIKRGILSTLQNTMTTLQGSSNGREVDVSGNCPVKYDQMTGGWSTRKVKKTKDLLGCTNRQSGQTIFQAIQYDAPSDIQSMPLMKSTHACEQEISTRDNIINVVTCNEVHMFRPFGRDDSGATTEVSYKLEFRTKSDGTTSQRGSSGSRSSLLYDQRQSDEEAADTVRDCRTSLTNLCRQTETDVRPDAPSIFNGLVKQMRKLDAANLKRLMAASKNGMCQKAERYFRDALPVLGTTGGVVVMRDLMAQNQATDEEIDRWLTSIGFINNPTPDMMKEVQPLLTSDFERSSLPVSSLINTYCQLYDQGNEVQQMIRTMEDELKYNCKYETETQRTRMLKALKAIGNAGNAESVVPTLNRCMNNKDIPISLRVAAITAFRRIPCTAERTELLTLMENKEADSELRIMAYLAVMQCANEDIINRVRNLLESTETANQVGSFIWTHLTNLQESSCPMKTNIQALLKDVVLSKTYDLDKRKFSRNIELSGFSEVFNVGALLESNLIWSPQSYIPRSASVNLTVDVFGQSVNLVELGGRAQGLEALIESYFSPMSDNSIRQRRAVIRDDALNNIDRKYQKSRDDLSLSYYLRVFGNEIKSGEIYDLDFDGLKNRFNFLRWMIMLAQENRIDITRNFLFLDSSFSVPTGAGMPLRLGVEGSATVAITASGKADIRQMFSFPSIFDINGSIRPSAAVEIRGEMGVDAHMATTGLKVVNTLHTSTILDGKIQLQNGVLFNLDLNLPQEKVEIFSAESHVYVTYRGQDREQQGLRPGAFQKTECTGQKLAYIVGVELCGEVSLASPFIAKAYVNKKDTFTGYHFEAGYRPPQADMTDSIRISLSTPGSQIDREITTEIKFDRANTQLDLTLKSPWKKLSASGSFVNSAALKRLTGRATVDERLEYSASAEFQIDDKPAEVRYVPTIRVSYPDSRGQPTEVLFDGSVVYTKGKKVAVNLALRNAFQQPITLDGTVELKTKQRTDKYDVNLNFGSQWVRGGLVGFVSNSQDSGKTWSSRAELSYQQTGRNKEKITINHKFRDLSTNNLRSYTTDCSWTSTVRPRYNGQLGLELAYSKNSLRSKIEVGLDNIKKLTIVQSGAFDFAGNDKKINGVLKVELPYNNWDYELKIDHLHNTETLQSNATVKYSKDDQMTLDVGLKKENARFLKVQGEAYFRMPGRDVSLTHSLVERAPREYYGDLSVQGIPRIGSASVATVYKMVPRHEFSADVTMEGWDQISIKTHLNPNPTNLEAHGEVTYGRKNYMGDINWMHRGNANSFNTRANGEIGYNGKSHAITTEVSKRNQEISTSVELKVEENHKYILNSQITANPTDPKVQVRFEWPRDNFMAVVGSGKYETRGWYATTSDLEGSIQFTSSIPRLEQFGASFLHDQSANSMKTKGEVSWASDKKITGDFSYTKNKQTIDLTTPFEGYQVIKGEAALTPKGRQWGHTTKLSWDGKQMVLAITGELNSPSVNGKVTFSSPFPNFESLAAGLKHVVTGNKYESTADVSWARGQQITLAMNMNHDRNGWSLNNNGDLTVKTPFRGYRVSKLTWSHQNDNNMVKCHKELEFDGKKYTVDIQGSHTLTRANRAITASASFESPIEGYENLRFSTEYQHDLRAARGTGKSSISWGTNAITYEHNLAYVPRNSLVFGAKVTTPFQGYETMALDMNNRINGNTYTSTNEVTMGGYGKSTLGGTLTIQGYNVDGNIRLTTPSRSLERVTATVRNSKQQDVWMSHADFEYGAEKSYSVDTQLGWESQKKVQIDIRTPHSNMRSMKFVGEVTGTLNNFQISSELQHNTFRQDKIMFTASADTTDKRRMNAMFELRTPFSAVSNFKVMADHTSMTGQRCVSTGSYEFNQYRGSLSQDFNFVNYFNWNTKTEVEYVTGSKLELSTAFAFDRKLSASATFKSPFQNARELSATLTIEGQRNNFKTGLELGYNRQKINTNLDFTLRDGTARIFYRLTTPYRSVERLAIEMNHSGRPGNYKSDVSYELNSQKTAANTELTSEEGSLRFTGQLESPYDSLRQARVSFSHNGEWSNFNNNGEISYDGNVIRATSQFNLEGPTASFTLNTPFEKVQSVNLNFAHENKITASNWGWSNTVSLELNSNRYSGESNWSWNGRQLRAKALTNIPDEYSITLQHTGGTIKDFSNTATLKLKDQTVTGKGQFKYTPTKIDAKASVDTTYPGYRKFEATFNHAGSASDFTCNAKLTTPFRNFNTMSADLTYSGTPNDFTSTFTLNTPFTSVPRLTITANHRYTENNLNCGISITGVSVTRPNDPLSASISYQKGDNLVTANARLQTPFDKYDNFEYSHRFEGVPKNYRSTTSITTPFEGYETMKWEVNHEDSGWSRLKTNAKFEGSMTSSPITYSIDISAPDAWHINSAFEYNGPTGQYGITFTNNGEPTNFRSGLIVRTPYREFSKWEVNLEHEGGLESPKSKLTVETPLRGYGRFEIATEKSGNPRNLQLKIEVTTPIRNWERTFASWSHSIDSSNTIQMNGQIESSLPNLNRISGTLNHRGGADSFETTLSVETPIRGYERQSATINHSAARRGQVKTTVTAETSLRDYSRFSGNFEYSTTRRGTKSSINVETPIRGYDRFGLTLNHNGDASQFETTLAITTPFTQPPQIDVTIRHRGQPTDFASSATIQYNRKQIATEVSFKKEASGYDSSYDATFKINSECPYLRDFSLEASHKRQPDVKTGSLDVTYNGEKKIDLDYRYTTSGDNQIEINIRNPYSMRTELNMAGSDGQAVVNWDTTRQDSQVRFDFGFKNTATSELTERSIRFKTALPRRTIGFEFGYSLAADRFTNRGELQWDRDAESEFVYEIEGSKTTPSRYVTSYDGTLKVISNLQTSTSTFSHKVNPRRKYTTELVIQTSERLRLSNDLTLTQTGFTHKILAQHPRFTQDASVTTEGVLSGNTNNVKTTVQYERQTFTVEGEVKDESSYSALRKSGTFRITHSTSNLDVQMNGDVYNDVDRAEFNGAVQYLMTRDRSQQKATVKSLFNKANKDYTLEIETPIDTLRVAAVNRYPDDSNGMYGYQVTAQTNQYNTKAVSELSLRDRSFDAKFYYNTADYLQIFAQGLSPLQARVEVTRYINGESTNDITASLALSDDRMLTGRAFIRPNLWQDMQRLSISDSSDFADKAQRWSRTMSDDFNMKRYRLQQAGAPFVNLARAVLNDFNAKVELISNEFNTMYNGNEFYIRDIHQAMQRAADRIREQMQVAMIKMRRWYSEFSNSVWRLLYVLATKIDDMSKCIADRWQEVVNRFEELRPYWEEAMEVVRARFEEVGNSIRNNPKVQELINRIQSIDLDDIKDCLRTAYINAKNKIDELLSKPELRVVRDWLINKVEETMWVYEYFGYQEQTRLWIEQMRSLTWQVVKDKMINYVKELLQLSKNKWTAWDVSRGEYAFQLYIPVDVFDLSFLQRFNIQKYIDYIRNIIARLIPDEDWALIDTIYKYWPSRDVTNWIPPFRSHASISGSQHILTFDHKFYEFAGECTYLLTRDFVDKSFHVTVNYDKMVNNMPTRKSITVISDGKQFEIFQDAKVTIDGVRSEMPIRQGNTTILRTGNAISVNNDRGFKVFCDLPHDHCSISVSGWYYNKLAGLLGTYDNEPLNDMTTIDGTLADKPETLAYSWTVGQKCRPNNRAVIVTADPESKQYEVCARYFKNSGSSMRSCFRQVDPEPFMKMCINDMPATDGEIENDEGVCKAAAAYVHECRGHEVHLRLPSQCVRCELPDSSRNYYEGSSFPWSANDQSSKMADVVFIVQHSPCNNNLIDKVKSAVDDLDKAMTAQGLLNTRYAIVGFGGKEHLSKPHIHTMDGQIFNTANKVAIGLNKFDLEAGDDLDPMAAIRYAVKMAFRAGSSKTFILLPCDTCTEKSIRYRDIQRALLESDIRLHVLVKDMIGVKSTQSPKSAFIWGADQSTVYTRTGVPDAELRGETDLRKYIKLPKDLCVALTQDTDGSIFSARQWIDSRPLIQKQFSDVMVRVFARKAQPSECQECECVADEIGVGFTQCSPCEIRSAYHSYYPDYEEELEPVVPPTNTTTGNQIPIKVSDVTATSRRTQPPRRPRLPTTRPTRRIVTRGTPPTRPSRPPPGPRPAPTRPARPQ